MAVSQTGCSRQIFGVSEDYRRMSDVYGEGCLSQRNVYKWLNKLESGKGSSQSDSRVKKSSGSSSQ